MIDRNTGGSFSLDSNDQLEPIVSEKDLKNDPQQNADREESKLTEVPSE